MGHFTEAVHNGQDDSMAFRRGKACHKVHGDVGPRAVGNRKRLQKSCWGPAGGLVLITDWAGFDEVLGVLFQAGPPEALEEGVLCPSSTRVAGELGGVGPLQHLLPQGWRDEQAVWRAGAGTRLSLSRCSHPLLDVPGHRGDKTGPREDGLWPLSRFLRSLELPGQGVGFGIT